MRIRHRLQLLCGSALLGCALLSLTGVWALNRMDHAMSASKEVTTSLRNQMEADMMHDAVRSDVLLAQLSLLRQDSAGAVEARKGFEEHSAHLRSMLEANERYLRSGPMHAALKEAQADMGAYLQQGARLVASTVTDPAVMQGEMSSFQQAFSRLEDSMSRLSDGIQGMAADEEKRALSAYDGSLALQFILLAFALTGMIFGGVWVMRSISRPLNEAVSAADAIAGGNLTVKIMTESRDETGDLMRSIERMRQNLMTMIGEVRDHANQVTSAAIQLSGAAQAVADSSKQQNDSAGDMASTIEEMSASITRVADHAQQASGISGQTAKLSLQGNDVIGRVVTGMKDIVSTVSTSSEIIQGLSQQSGQINDIVKVIKDIADQTNLLALNAAIEAARAGEQGRGFAVVADEVRNLAARTAQSTDEINSVVQRILESTRQAMSSMQSGVSVVGEGERLAAEAGDAILGIRNNADSAIASVEQIAHAMQEQQIASSAIAHRVHEIVAMSERNDKAVQEAADTAVHLNDLAVKMQVAVSRFRI